MGRLIDESLSASNGLGGLFVFSSFSRSFLIYLKFRASFSCFFFSFTSANLALFLSIILVLTLIRLGETAVGTSGVIDAAGAPEGLSNDVGYF